MPKKKIFRLDKEEAEAQFFRKDMLVVYQLIRQGVDPNQAAALLGIPLDQIETIIARVQQNQEEDVQTERFF